MVRREAGSVLVAGMPRSGSTWCYNATRLVLEAAGCQVQSGWWRDLDFNAPKEWLLVKAHRPEDVAHFQADYVLTTRRDLCECIASRQNMGWQSFDEDNIVKAGRRQRELYAHWNARSDLEISFADIKDSPEKALRDIAALLGLADVPVRDVLHALQALKPPAGGSYDSVTLLHPKHLNDPELTKSRARQVAGILRRHGEPLDFS
jgi:hypothetical protein